MKTFFIGICCALCTVAFGQTVTTKTYAWQTGQQVSLKFDYPVVKVSTWAKNEVSVTAHVNINDDENDAAFELDQQTVNGTIAISGKIKDMDKLPRRYTVVRDGKKMIYKTKEDFETADKVGMARGYSNGPDITIVVEIKLPVGAVTTIKAVYGIVEVTDCQAPLTVDATYGGIDATLAPARTGKLQATTSYGQIYSNLDLKLTDHTQRDFFTSITAEPGSGPAYQFTSTYGKVYLRKPF